MNWADMTCETSSMTNLLMHLNIKQRQHHMTCNLGGICSLLFSKAVTATEGQSEIYLFTCLTVSFIPSVNVLFGPFNSVMMSIEAAEPGSVTPPSSSSGALSVCGPV